jgi:predicted negative regulator of RcsB-dependent stress response
MSKTAHELTRKEMKGPDKFQLAASEAATWMARRQKQIVGAVILGLVVVAAGIGINSYLESQRSQAGGLLYKALDQASGEVSSIPLPNFDRPIFKSAEEKQKALLAAAEKVRQRYGSSRSALTAALIEGDAQLALAQWDQAIAAYQKFLDGAPADDSLRFGAIDGLARAQEGKGDLEAAAKTYARGADIEFYKDRAALERSRVLAKAGKTDEARKALEAVSKDSALSGEAQERLSRLGAK